MWKLRPNSIQIKGRNENNLHDHTVHTSTVSLGSPDDPGADPGAGGWGVNCPCDFGRPSVYQL